jgi:hypothetical protein
VTEQVAPDPVIDPRRQHPVCGTRRRSWNVLPRFTIDRLASVKISGLCAAKCVAKCAAAQVRTPAAQCKLVQ